MKIFLILFIFTISANTLGYNKKHPIYNRILEINPKLDHKYAMTLSNYIHKYSKMYDQNAMLSVAIAAQESLFHNKHRRQQVIVFDKNSYSVHRGFTDLCLYQIHINTALNYGLDLLKLHTDVEYCVEQHFKILTKKRKLCKHLEKDDWTCYHSKTEVNRLHYKKLVERFIK